jgi:hypothetical protein
MAVNLIAYRGRNDDGNETTATWKAAENTAWVQAFDTNFRVRFLHQNDTAQILNLDILLQYSLNGGAYTAVSATSSVVRSSASPNLADAANLTTQLTGGTGTYVGATGYDEVNGICGGTSMDVTATGHFETEFCVQLRSAEVARGDTVTLRTFNNDAGAAWGTYTVVATLTAPPVTIGAQDFILKPPLGTHHLWGHPLSQGLIGHWIMNEGSGVTVYDQSPYGNHGALSGSVTWGTGKFGHALSYDAGANGVVTAGAGTVTTFDDLPATTFAAWVYPTSIGSEEAIIYKVVAGGTNGKGLFLGATNAIRFFVDRATDSTAVSAVDIMMLNEWQHVAATWVTGTAPQLFRNGVEVAYVSQAVGAGALVTEATGGITIGNRDGLNIQFNGLIDDARVYDRALTPGEINWLYTDPFADMVTPRIIIGRREVVVPTFVPFPFRGDGGFDNMMGGLR